MDIKNNLVGEFEFRLDELGVLKLGTEEYKLATESLTKLADRIIEIEKIESESKKIERENDLKKKELIGDWIDKGLQLGVDIGKFGIAVGVYWLAFQASTNFEKIGTMTTPGGRGATDRLLNKLIKF